MSDSRNLAKKRRIRRSESEWRELFVRFETSGLSRAAFCAEQGVVLSSFARWWRRLRPAARRAPALMADPVFVELAAERDPGTHWDVELELGAGMVLRLRRPGC